MNNDDGWGKFVLVLIGLAWAGGSAFGVMWIWPDGIFDVPLARLTLGMIGKAMAAVMFVFSALFGLGIVGAAFD